MDECPEETHAERRQTLLRGTSRAGIEQFQSRLFHDSIVKRANMKNYLRGLLLSGLLLLLLAACNIARYQSPDPFFHSRGEWDNLQFPLIKPYEAVKLDGIEGWGINLPFEPSSSLLYGGVGYVEKIAIVGNVIMVYTPYDPGFSETMQDRIAYWFVLIPDEHVQVGFKGEEDFLEYILEYGIHEVDWEGPEGIFQRFTDTGCLDWIPGCK